jgi:hypothetical protein
MTTVAEPIAASRRRLERILITIAPLGGVVAVLALAAVTTPGLFVLAGQVPPFVAIFAVLAVVAGVVLSRTTLGRRAAAIFVTGTRR